MSTVADIAAGLAVAALLLGPSVVCWLKGKRLWATLGFITQWHWIPVFRLAKPESWWARRYYDDEKMRRSRIRFNNDDPHPGRESASESPDAFSAEDVALEDKITRKAWAKAQKQRH